MRLFLLGLLFWVFNSTHVLSQLPNIPNPFKKKNQPLVADTSDIGKVLQYLEERSPVSTSFDDALYESEVMKDFEPSTNQYQPLEIQPNAEKGGFRLNSGLYTMMAKSFCLKAGTYGPSSGDGHLYAPLAGRKREMVETILERYAKHPDIPQQKIQVLLWAIIARADLASLLKSEHFISLKKLFSIAELAKLFITDKLDAVVDQKIALVDSKMPPLVKKALHAEQEIQNLLTNNPIYEKLEQVAVLAGIAPAEDMIRQVSRGRWSYHPDGYFVRFFPQGYKQTRIDVYVPNSTSVELDATGKQVLSHNANTQGKSKEIVFNPAKMVAVPANRSSQRIGVSPVPEETNDKYKIIFYAYGPGTWHKGEGNSDELEESLPGHIYVGFYINNRVEQVKGFNPIMLSWKKGKVDQNTDQSYLLGYHADCFPVEVSKKQYNNALNINNNNYFIGANDCVSYAAEVAQVIGLSTPSFSDFILRPMTYLSHLKAYNGGVKTVGECGDQYRITFYAYSPGKEHETTEGNVDKSPTGHIFVGYYKNGKMESVRGFSPVMRSLWDPKKGEVSDKTDESHLVDASEEQFSVIVTKGQYEKGLSIRKTDYILGFNDCVSYADDLADAIGLNTPTFIFDPLDFSFPMLYIRYLQRNN
jgi:hypothetical protein